MKDFPPIYQERNPGVLTKLIVDFVKESGIILDAETSETPNDAPLQVRPRSQRKTRLKHPILTKTLLQSPRGKEEKGNPLQLILKISLQKLEMKGPRK